jgi:signal transduction histidine kinase
LSKICYLTFIILFISCSYNKELGSRETLFDTKEYYNKESFEKKIYLDSLNKLSNKIINDSTNRNFLFELSTQYYYLNQFQKSLEVNKKNLIFSIEARDSLGIAMSYYYIGDCYEINKKDSAYYYYQKAEKLYRLLTKNELVGKMLFNKAYILFFEGNYIESEIMISNSLKLLNKSNDKQLIFSCYNLIGINFEKLEEYEESLKYYLLAKDFLNGALHDKDDFDKKNNYKITLAVNIANIYEKQSQFENAKQELESILTPELNEQWPNQYSTVIGNLGYVKTKLGNLKEGEALMKEALSLSKKSGIESNIVYKLHNLGKYYFDIKDTLQAVRYLKESLQLAEKLKSSDDAKVNLQLLSRIDKANTSYYDKRYIAISDSLNKVQRKNRNKYARIEYETSVVEDANKELNSKNLYLIVGVVVLAGALGIRYVLGQRKEIAYRKQLQAAELELFDLMRSSQIELNRAREEEQNRISRELHDNVMNKIYGARLQLGMLNPMTSLEAEEKRSKQIDNLQLIEQDIRSIAHDLYSDVVSHFDFSELLVSCVQQATATTEFYLDCDERIDWESISGLVKITIYRIVQEALSNVSKYAEASQCFVTITQLDATSLRLTVIDNGKGFDMNQTTKGIGLKNMSTRARAVKADFTIHSSLEQGTRVECQFVI